MRSQTTERSAEYSKTRPLRKEIHNLANEHSNKKDADIRGLATSVCFDIDEDCAQLSDAADELVMLMCSATFRDDDELIEDQQAVVAHGSELARLVDKCMRDGTDICKADVLYYARKLSEKRKKAGLIQYEDICGK